MTAQGGRSGAFGVSFSEHSGFGGGVSMQVAFSQFLRFHVHSSIQYMKNAVLVKDETHLELCAESARV